MGSIFDPLLGQLRTTDAAGTGSGDMILAANQTNTGTKTFVTGSLLMRDPTNTFSSEPYSDSNPPFTLNMSDQASSPATPVTGQSTLYTTDGTNINLKDDSGTTITMVDTSTTQTIGGDKTFSGNTVLNGTNTLLSFVLNGSYKSNVSVRTASVTLATSSVEFQVLDGTSNAVAITLPSTASPGYKFTFVRRDAVLANAVTLVGTFNGTSGYALSSQYDYVTIESTSTAGAWLIIGSSKPTTAPQLATIDLGVVLSNLGFRAAGAAYPISTSGAVTFGGSTTLGFSRYSANSRTTAVTLTPGSSAQVNTVDATTGTIVVTLAATANAGWKYDIVKSDASVNTVSIVTAGGTGTINGVSTYTLSSQYDYVTVVSTAVSGVWIITDSSQATAPIQNLTVGGINNTSSYRASPGNRTATVTLATSSGESQSIDATAGNVAITLPATTSAGYRFSFRRIDATANTATVVAGTSINGVNAPVVLDQYDVVTLESTSISGVWLIITDNRNVKVRPYTTTGTAVWTKPAGLKYLEVTTIAGGSGGGSGRRGATLTARFGGGGGSGGGIAYGTLPATSLGTTENVLVGVGGTGGAAVTIDNTDGNPGTTGGGSFFGTIGTGIGSRAGAASSGGTATSGLGATGNTAGGNSSATATAAAGGGSFGMYLGAGAGGGGGGITIADAPLLGGAGGASFVLLGNGATTAPGATPTGATAGYAIPGQGGPGATSNVTTTGVAGTNGALYGSGGGGGAASINGFNSGAGGNGAQGIVLVIEHF